MRALDSRLMNTKKRKTEIWFPSPGKIIKGELARIDSKNKVAIVLLKIGLDTPGLRIVITEQVEVSNDMES